MRILSSIALVSAALFNFPVLNAEEATWGACENDFCVRRGESEVVYRYALRSNYEQFGWSHGSPALQVMMCGGGLVGGSFEGELASGENVTLTMDESTGYQFDPVAMAALFSQEGPISLKMLSGGLENGCSFINEAGEAVSIQFVSDVGESLEFVNVEKRGAIVHRPLSGTYCREFSLGSGYVTNVDNHRQIQLVPDTILQNVNGPAVFGGTTAWAALICPDAPVGVYEVNFIALDGRGGKKSLESLTLDIREDRVPDGSIEWIDPDSDGDGVLDNVDACPDTAEGLLVDETGCSGAQSVANICPADDEWKNHGGYVSCVSNAVEDAVETGLLTEEEGEAVINSAARSDVGKPNKGKGKGKG